MPKKLKLGTSVTWDTGSSVTDSGWGSSSTVGGDSSAFYGRESVNTLEPSRFHAARDNSQTVHNDWGGGWGEPAPDFSQDSFPTLGGAPQTSGKRQEPSVQSKAKYTKPNFADLIYAEPAKAQYTMQPPSRPLRPTTSAPRPADPSPRTMNFTPSTPVGPYKPTTKPATPLTRKLDSLETSPMLRPPAYTLPTPTPYSLPTAAPITMPPPKSNAPSYHSQSYNGGASASTTLAMQQTIMEARADEIVEKLHLQMAATSNRAKLRFIFTSGDIRVEQIH